MEDVYFYTVTDPFMSSKGFILYKITRNKVQFLNQNFPETEKIYWKRFSDFYRLFMALSTFHSKLHRQERFPEFPKSSNYNRFDEHIIDERRQSAQDLLNFIGQRPYLVNSKIFKEFFKEDVKAKSISMPSTNPKSLRSKIGGSPINKNLSADNRLLPTISYEDDNISLKLEEAINDDVSLDSASNSDILSLTSEFDFHDFAPSLVAYGNYQSVVDSNLEGSSVDRILSMNDQSECCVPEPVNRTKYSVSREKYLNRLSRVDNPLTHTYEKRQNFLSCSQSFDTLNVVVTANPTSGAPVKSKDDIAVKNETPAVARSDDEKRIIKSFKPSSSESNLKNFFLRLPSSFRVGKTMMGSPKKKKVPTATLR